jgi:hypothetical protein
MKNIIRGGIMLKKFIFIILIIVFAIFIMSIGVTCDNTGDTINLGGDVEADEGVLTPKDIEEEKSKVVTKSDDTSITDSSSEKKVQENNPPEITSVEIRDENNTEWLVIDDIGWVFSPNIEFKLNVSDSDGDSITYEWNCPDGELSSTEQSDTKWTAPEIPGTYTIEVLISDENGAEIIQSFDIEIFTPPEPQNTTLEPTPSDSGTLVLGGDSFIGSEMLFGDSGCNNTAIGLAIFNIGQILGTVVTEANLIIDIVDYGGDLSFLNQDIQIDFLTFVREDVGTAYDIYNSYPFEGMFRVSGGSLEDCLNNNNIVVPGASETIATKNEPARYVSDVLSNGIKDMHNVLFVAVGSPIDYTSITARTNLNNQWDGIVVSPRLETMTIALPEHINEEGAQSVGKIVKKAAKPR